MNRFDIKKNSFCIFCTSKPVYYRSALKQGHNFYKNVPMDSEIFIRWGVQFRKFNFVYVETTQNHKKMVVVIHQAHFFISASSVKSDKNIHELSVSGAKIQKKCFHSLIVLNSHKSPKIFSCGSNTNVINCLNGPIWLQKSIKCLKHYMGHLLQDWNSMYIL